MADYQTFLERANNLRFCIGRYLSMDQKKVASGAQRTIFQNLNSAIYAYDTMLENSTVLVELPESVVETLKAMHGCLDGSCKFGRIPSNVQTNGGCHCDSDILNTRALTTTQRYAIMKALKVIRSTDVQDPAH